jgi:hypothetical protein
MEWFIEHLDFSSAIIQIDNQNSCHTASSIIRFGKSETNSNAKQPIP